MKFEIFDRENQTNIITSTANATVSRNGYIALNMASKTDMGVSVGDKVRVLKNGKNWYLVQTKAQTGFTLNPQGKKNSHGVRLCSRGVVNEILKAYGNQDKVKFYLQDTEQDFEGYPVFELLPKYK